MTDEMDLMGMAGGRRLAWLRANRATLLLVGLVWLGMIVRELALGNAPVFLMAMVPAFALGRFAFYLYYAKRQNRSGAL